MSIEIAQKFQELLRRTKAELGSAVLPAVPDAEGGAPNPAHSSASRQRLLRRRTLVATLYQRYERFEWMSGLENQIAARSEGGVDTILERSRMYRELRYERDPEVRELLEKLRRRELNEQLYRRLEQRWCEIKGYDYEHYQRTGEIPSAPEAETSPEAPAPTVTPKVVETHQPPRPRVTRERAQRPKSDPSDTDRDEDPVEEERAAIKLWRNKVPTRGRDLDPEIVERSNHSSKYILKKCSQLRITNGALEELVALREQFKVRIDSFFPFIKQGLSVDEIANLYEARRNTTTENDSVTLVLLKKLADAFGCAGCEASELESIVEQMRDAFPTWYLSTTIRRVLAIHEDTGMSHLESILDVILAEVEGEEEDPEAAPRRVRDEGR